MSTPIGTIWLGGCDVVWDDAVLNSTQVALNASDAVVYSLYQSDYPTSEDKGTVVSGASAISMTYVTGSNGKFIGPLAASVALTWGSYYVLEVTATPSGGSPHTRHGIVRALHRGFNP